MNQSTGLVLSSVSIQRNHILKDDVGLLYRVVEIFPYSMVVEVFPNDKHFGCEVITYNTFVEEGWKIIGLAY